jgi:hypothetical protein
MQISAADIRSSVCAGLQQPADTVPGVVPELDLHRFDGLAVRGLSQSVRQSLPNPMIDVACQQLAQMRVVFLTRGSGDRGEAAHRPVGLHGQQGHIPLQIRRLDQLQGACHIPACALTRCQQGDCQVSDLVLLVGRTGPRWRRDNPEQSKPPSWGRHHPTRRAGPAAHRRN